MLTRPHYRRLAMIAMLSVAALTMPGSPAVIAREGSPSICKDAKVANFVAAELMDNGHQAVTLSFWSGPYGKMIEYDPGRGSGPVQLELIDREGQGLRVRTPNGAIWTVTLSKGLLLLRDGGARPRVFLWQYQGPINGRGTACPQCVSDESALQFVADEFMQARP